MNRTTMTALLAGLLLPLCGTASAQVPVAGQPYQVPAGCESYGAGTVISYGGFSYVIQGNGTMLFTGQSAGTPTQAGVDAAQSWGGSQRLGVVNDQGRVYYFYDGQGNVRYYLAPDSAQAVSVPSPTATLGGSYRIGVTNDRGWYRRFYDNRGDWGTQDYYQGMQNPEYQQQYENDVARWRYRNTTRQNTAAPRRSSTPSWMRYYNQYQNFAALSAQMYQGYGGYGGYSGYSGYGGSGGYSGGSSGSYGGSGGSDPTQLIMTDPGPKR